MSKTALSRGLVPRGGSTWEDSPATHLSMLWGGLHFHMHRYGANPIGQFLVGWTITMLCEMGHRPTVMELSKAVGLPRSTVSRYVNQQIRDGYVEERINPADRRRRELYRTDVALQELEYLVEFFHSMYKGITDPEKRDQRPKNGADLLATMIRISEKFTADPA